MSPSQLLDASLARISQVEEAVNAIPTVCAARARDTLADLADHEKKHGNEPVWLGGLPIGIKDLTQVASVPVAFATDNLPPSMFHPISHAVARRDEMTGETIAPAQKLSREEALRCASWGGAFLTGQEDQLGTLEPGKRADLVILNDDFMSVSESAISGLHSDVTIVDGRVVFDRGLVGLDFGTEVETIE